MATVTRQKPLRPVKAGASKPTLKKAVSKALPPKKSSPPARGKDGGFLGRSPISIFCFGPPGVGKTSMFSYMPRPMWVIDPQEEGIEDLVEFGQAKAPAEETKVVDSFENLMDVLADAANKKWDIETLCLDSATGFEKLCFHYHCEQNFGGDWTKEGFYAFQQGPKNAAKTDWPKFLDACDDVRKAGINIVLLAHSQVKAFHNPEGPDYDQFIPYLDKETWAQTHRWAKAVLFYNYDVGLEKKGLKHKVKVGEELRMIYTTHSAAYAAKNRWGLDPAIEAGESGEDAYNAFCKAFLKAAKAA